MGTRTGQFPIGFRRGGGWQDNTSELAAWAGEAGFDAIDLGRATKEDIQILRDNGLQVGTCDVLDMGAFASPDEGERKATVDKNIDYIKEIAALGVDRFFVCLVPRDATKTRAENYDYALKSLDPLAHVAADVGACIVIEGWPGGFPYHPTPCCNPETYRRIINDINCPGVGVNYDPSHLIRMGIDHIRFLEEFLPHVGHVHAKDTEILTEALYEYGTLQTSAFEDCFHCGENYWRYTIPGHGQARWLRAFEMLVAANWKGIISIELEDNSFHGSPEADKQGYLCSKVFLETV